MAPIIEIFGMICLTTITGTLYFLCWIIVKNMLDKQGYVKATLQLLGIALIGYTVPILYLAVKWLGWKNGGRSGVFLLPTPYILQSIEICSIIWFCGVLAILLYYGSGILLLSILIRRSCPCDLRTRRILETCCRKLNFQEAVQVRWISSLKKPLVKGCRKFVICLPDPKIYTDEELELIFLHELTHCKDRDVLLKNLLAVIHCVHWFNPFLFLVTHEVGKWTEARCDDEVWRIVPNVKAYYILLMKISIAANKRPVGLTAGFWERKSYLKKRILRMERNMRLEEGKKKSRKFVAGMVALLVLLTATTALAAGEAVKAGYSRVFKETAVRIQEETVAYDSPEDEMTSHLDEKTDVRIVEAPEADASPYSSLKNINWEVKDDVLKQSAAFSVRAGGKITVSFSIAPAGKTVNVGIVDSDGYLRYVTGADDIYHQFKITTTDFYRVYVENNSGTTVDVTGYYKSGS